MNDSSRTSHRYLKEIIAGAVLVVILATPLSIGFYAKHKLHEYTDWANKFRVVEVTVSDYDRGFFESSIYLKLKIPGGLPEITASIRLSHGPFFFEQICGAKRGWLAASIQLSVSERDDESGDGCAVISPSRRAASLVISPGFLPHESRWQIPDGGTANLEIVDIDDSSNVLAKITVPTAYSMDARSELHLNNVEYSVRSGLNVNDIPEVNMHVTIDELHQSSKLRGATISTVNDISFDMLFLEKDELADYVVKLGYDNAQISGIEIDGFGLEFAGRRIDSDALLNFIREAQNRIHNLQSYPELSSSLGVLFRRRGASILKHAPVFSLNQLVAYSNWGRLSVVGEFEIDGRYLETPLAFADLAPITDGGLSAELPKQLIDGLLEIYVRALVSRYVAQEGLKLTDADFRIAVAETHKAYLHEMTERFLLWPYENNYLIRFTADKGELRWNTRWAPTVFKNGFLLFRSETL